MILPYKWSDLPLALRLQLESRGYSMPLFARSTDRRDFFATTCALLENLSCNPSTGFGIGQCLVVIFEMKPTAFGHCVELMIR